MDKSKFLNLMSMIESSGGKNLNHKPITKGIQAGTVAQGQYGLMPNTIDEMQRRAAAKGEDIPQSDEEVANAVADHIAAKTDDPRKQAYMWQYGHNLDPNKLSEEQLGANPRVQKFDQLAQKMGIKPPVSPQAKLSAKPEVQAGPDVTPQEAPVESDVQEPIKQAPVAIPPKPQVLQAQTPPVQTGDPLATQAALPKAMTFNKLSDFDEIGKPKKPGLV
jgi:hypothetical protein